MIFENRFGRMERLLHRFAFRTGFSQTMLADVEDRIFADRLASIEVTDPVFISGLPRSGTTILLQLLYRTGHFATHTYRDMPFVLCPLLWNQFSANFEADSEIRERAHGDGIKVSARSPEAFEEILWKRFWPGQYAADRIVPWEPGAENREFRQFFERHAKKIIALHETRGRTQLRYLSKNNVNIARLAARPGLLSDGILLLPFREPLQHAASMLSQHQRFIHIHKEDRFARRYMEAVGHHDFGLDLRPIDFGGWITGEEDPETLDFWLAYWCAAYQFVLENPGPRLHLVPYDRLTMEPARVLAIIARAIDMPAEGLTSLFGEVHLPRRREVDAEHLHISALVDDAMEIHEELLRSAAV